MSDTDTRVLNAFMQSDTFRDSISNIDEFEELPEVDKYSVAQTRFALLGHKVDLQFEDQDTDTEKAEKEWVPYVGPRGGEGWRSTNSQAVRYQPDKPTAEGDDHDPTDVDQAAVEDAGIHQTRLWEPTQADDLQVGYKVRSQEGDHQWDGRVTEILDDEIVFETESLREIRIPTDENGIPQETLQRPKTVFFGTGIANVNYSFLPEGEEASETQLQAEAVRSATTGDGIGETKPLEAFIGLALARGQQESDVSSAVDLAIDKHPYLYENEKEEIMANGRAMVEEHTPERIEAIHKDLMDKGWVRYEGPRGGLGWQNAQTGDVVYSEEAPGEVEGGAEDQTQTTLDTGTTPEINIKEPKWMDDGTARLAVYQSLPEDAYEAIAEASESGEWSMSADEWLEGATAWIEANGDENDIKEIQTFLDQYDTNAPWTAYSDEITAPENMNPEYAEDMKAFNEMDIPGGISADSMWVADMGPDHKRLFITNGNDKVGSNEEDFTMKAAAESAKFMESFGLTVPEHHYEEGEFLAVAEADGSAVGDRVDRIDFEKETYMEHALATLMVGNRDAHEQNVFLDYTYSGYELINIDLDLAGTDLTAQRSSIENTLGKLFEVSVRLGLYEPYDNDDSEQFKEDILSYAEDWFEYNDPSEPLEAVDDDEMREIFETNIEALKSGELIGEDTVVRSML